jgi:hypothetical protein
MRLDYEGKSGMATNVRLLANLRHEPQEENVDYKFAS